MKRAARRRSSGGTTRHTAPQLRLGVIGARELVVDLFAGGGGTSEGIKAAIGRDPDIAINHDPLAVTMHEANHPRTKHYCESVFKIAPRDAVQGRPVGLLWLSPDCTHFSKSKGGKPRSKKIRGLAWVAVRWAREAAPRVIILENVEEFEGWGPLLENGLPDPARAGRTFRSFVSKLRGYGYAVEWRLLVAADYGVPTTRKRLFLIARRDRQPIAWPAPTHSKTGQGRKRWRPAADVIDWSIPCPSIFERKKPLAEPTLRRIAVGIWRYVINAAQPFIVPVTHPRDARVHGIDEPVRTVTGANRGELALVAPYLVHRGNGEREGQTPRTYPIERPVSTVVAQGQKHALVAALMTKHYGGVVGHDLHRPIGTVTSIDHHAVSVAFLDKAYGSARVGVPVDQPVPTITAGGGRGGGHLADVRAFLVKYNRTGTARDLDEPLDTVTTRDRFGLVTIAGENYAIVDIGMRMLSPRELFRAQGFPDGYQIAPACWQTTPGGKRWFGPLIKTEQIAKCGNAVNPKLAEVLVGANFREREAVAA